MLFFWLGFFIFALIIEAITVDLVSIWFAGGALVSLVLACFNVNWVVQVIVFVVVTVFLLLCTRVIFKKKLFNDKVICTNVDSLIGSRILVVDDVSFDKLGAGKIRDIVWTCKVDSDIVFCVGDYAIVDRVEGNKLVIRRDLND